MIKQITDLEPASTIELNKDCQFVMDTSSKNTKRVSFSNLKEKLLDDVYPELLDDVYPVGSLYFGLQETCPMETLIKGSVWEKIDGGRSIWTKEDGQTLGELVDGVLPKHTHSLTEAYESTVMAGSGANGVTGSQSTSSGTGTVYSSEVKNVEMGTTLRPPSLVINIWKRTQ